MSHRHHVTCVLCSAGDLLDADVEMGSPKKGGNRRHRQLPLVSKAKGQAGDRYLVGWRKCREQRMRLIEKTSFGGNRV